MSRALMISAAFGGCLWVSAATAGVQEEAPAVPSIQDLPSGLSVTLQEHFVDTLPDGSDQARFRFVAPGLGQGAGFARVESDFPILCADIAVPTLATTRPDVTQVIISMAAKPLAFGATDPSVVQYFEAFRIENGSCIWEVF
ncbi:MAG: DUF6497 family protein [Pelagimonas sp.]|nr:DUF6497 family protein [Pelagimonas sp.]